MSPSVNLYLHSTFYWYSWRA